MRSCFAVHVVGPAHLAVDAAAQGREKMEPRILQETAPLAISAVCGLSVLQALHQVDNYQVIGL